MKSEGFNYSNYKDTLDFPILLLFIAGVVVSYLRMIAFVVDERKRAIVENLENMGMTKFSYAFSVLLFFFSL